MIYMKKNIINKISNWKDESIHILTDFDRTITIGNSDSSWSILAKTNLVPKKYIFERQKLYNYYRPIEIDESLDYDIKNKLMNDWWHKHIDLLIKYKISEAVINEAAQNLRVMAFRNGARKFLKNMKDRNIPIIILSAGIGNFIEQFLIKNKCNYDNIYIISNLIKFEKGIAVGVSKNVIHSLNKNEVSLPNNIKKIIKNRPNIILLGDGISDLKMAQEKENVLKIGFLNENITENINCFKDQFDIVCTNNTSFNCLSKKINILSNKNII